MFTDIEWKDNQKYASGSMRSYVFKFDKNNLIIYPANSTDEVYHSNSLIFCMRYGPCVKTNGTAHAKLGDVFDPP